MLIVGFTYKSWELVNFGPLKLLGQSPGIELINLSCSAQIDHIRWSHFVRISKTLSGGEIRLGGCGHMTLVYDSFLLPDSVSSQLKELKWLKPDMKQLTRCWPMAYGWLVPAD